MRESLERDHRLYRGAENQAKRIDDANFENALDELIKDFERLRQEITKARSARTPESLKRLNELDIKVEAFSRELWKRNASRQRTP